MRVLVCGDRNWADLAFIQRVLAAVLDDPVDVVIHGCARGADTQAGTAAKRLGIKVAEFPAQWGVYGRAAGPIRNKQMLTAGKPDLVLAFHDNIAASKGTANMVTQARGAGVPVRIYSHTQGPQSLF